MIFKNDNLYFFSSAIDHGQPEISDDNDDDGQQNEPPYGLKDLANNNSNGVTGKF
jgi:hypothetical protein